MPSEKILEQKKVEVSALAEKIKNAQSFVLADYRGLTVLEDTELRAELRENNVEYKVIKNSIIKHALAELGIEGYDDYLKGPTAIAISENDVVAPAKILDKYAKKYEVYEIKAGSVEGNFADVEQIKEIAGLGSREELLAKMLGGLNAIICNLAYAINAVIDQKGGVDAAEEAPAEEAAAEATAEEASATEEAPAEETPAEEAPAEEAAAEAPAAEAEETPAE